MSGAPDIAVIICTFERPGHLSRCLLSLAAQRGVDGRFEVFIVDDGSRDHTPDVVERFRREARFPVMFVTHPKDGFQQSRCRNEVGSSRVDLQACKLEYSIVSPK